MWRQQFRGNKYHAKKTEYDGVQYHSKFEAGFAQGLDMRLKAKEIKGWERQVKISLDVNGYHIANYYIDFVVHHLDKTKEYVEVKGFETDVWRMKWKLTEALLSKEVKKGKVLLTVVK